LLLKGCELRLPSDLGELVVEEGLVSFLWFLLLLPFFWVLLGFLGGLQLGN